MENPGSTAAIKAAKLRIDIPRGQGERRRATRSPVAMQLSIVKNALVAAEANLGWREEIGRVNHYRHTPAQDFPGVALADPSL